MRGSVITAALTRVVLRADRLAIVFCREAVLVRTVLLPLIKNDGIVCGKRCRKACGKPFYKGEEG